MGRKIVALLVMVSAFAFAFPTDIPSTIDSLLAKMGKNFDKALHPNLSQTYVPPSASSLVGVATKPHIYISFTPYPSTSVVLGYRLPLRYREVIIYAPPFSYPYYPPIVYQPVYPSLDLALALQLLETKEELEKTKEEVKEVKEELKELKNKLQELQGKVFCPQCGREMDPQWEFCPYDGTPLKQEKKLSKEEEKLVELYSEVLKKAFYEGGGKNGFIAVATDNLGLTKEGQEALFSKLRVLSENIYDLKEALRDKEKFKIDGEGKIVEAVNGTVLALKVKAYDGEGVTIEALCWRTSANATLLTVQAKYLNGFWNLSLTQRVKS